MRTAGGGVLDLPSPSEVGPEPLRTELSRSANLVAAGFRREGRGGTQTEMTVKTKKKVKTAERVQSSHSCLLISIKKKKWLEHV